MNKAAKSFSFAAVLFGKEQLEGSQLLYGWCRHCDDAVDEAPNQELASNELDRLKEMTELSINTKEKLHENSFIALRHLATKYHIPSQYPKDLIAGMEMDVKGFNYIDQNDLELYCYRVAGVVGLMMSHITGLKRENALNQAVAAGMAMQMTNISRDIVEDYERGRIYLPQSWFEQANLNYPPRDAEELKQSAAHLMPRLLDRADELYSLGRQGLIYLPIRAALAVSVAIEIYSEIGNEVLKKKEQAWEERCYVPKWKKYLLAGIGVTRVLSTIPKRLIQKRKPQAIKTVWRFQ